MTVTIAIPFVGTDEIAFRLAIRSVFAQTEPDWRLLLLDDGANPDLLRAASEINDARVSVLSDGKRLGLAARLNQVAQICETELLFRMDADDIMMPHRVARQTKALRDDESLDVCGGSLIAIDESGAILGYYARERRVDTAEQLLSAPYFSHPTVAGRASWFRRNPYNESIRRAEDKELWLRTRDVSIFRNIDEPLLFYRMSMTFNRQKAMRTLSDDAKVTWPYARKWLGPVSITKYCARIAAKTIAYTLGGDRIWHVKMRAITSEREDAEERFVHMLNSVASTPVRGWQE